MRRRLLSTTLAVLAAALLAFAVPLAVAVRGQLTDQALDELQGQVTQIATFVEEQARTCAEARLILTIATQAQLDVALFDVRGDLLFAAGRSRPTGTPPDVLEAIEGRVGRARLDDRLAVAVPVSSEVCRVPLVLHAATGDEALDAAVRRSWLGIAGVGVGVLLLAAAAAWLLGIRLARPLEALAASARRLGDGDFSTRSPRSGLPEPDEIAEALDTTADRLGRTVARGAAFTADASHQLRTPLTALRLHLESLAAAGVEPAAVRDALGEADRLDATIRELVALTRLDGPADDLDLVALVQDRSAAWVRRAEAAGRRLEVETIAAPPVAARPAAIGQALEVLVDNALRHGRGVVTVRVTPTLPAIEGAGGARVCVADEGSGPAPGTVEEPPAEDRRAGARRHGGDGAHEVVPLQGGRGLVLARSLVSGEGGRLVTERFDAGWRACLVLPGGRSGAEV